MDGEVVDMALDFDLGEGVGRLRQELRALIAEHVPADYLGAFTEDPADLEIAQRFCKTLADRGLLCIAWPAEWGGRDASVWEQAVVREEMWAHHEPRGAQYMGVNWVGPAIMRHGTPDQQQLHLPAIAAGEVIWCQGFSEPNAGSDLASLKTAARPTDDGWRINGQKVWTSYAGIAQWCFLLARTSTGERKQQGLTIFLVPMSSPGITVRPLKSMLGPHHLNEVFFDEVAVGPSAVLGEVGTGWHVAQEALAFERVGIARYARCERLLLLAPEVLGRAWDTLPGHMRAKWAHALTRSRMARLMAYRVVDAQSRGAVAPRDSAAYRIAATKCDQETADILVEIIGFVDIDGDESLRFRRAVEDHWRYAQAATVAGGSTQMQRILLARSLVGRL